MRARRVREPHTPHLPHMQSVTFPQRGTVTRKISEKCFGSLLQVKTSDGQCLTISTDAVGLSKGDKVEILSGTRKYWEAGKQWQLVKCKVDVIFDRIPESTATTQILVKGLRKLFIKNVKGVGKVAADNMCNSGQLERLSVKFLDGAKKDELINSMVKSMKGSAVSTKLSRYLQTYPSAHAFIIESIFLALGNIRCKLDDVSDHKRFVDCLLTKPYTEMTLDAIGFLKCDELAHALDLHRTPQRLEAALCHCLNEVAKSDGHCYLPRDELFTKTRELMSIPRDEAEAALERCIGRGESSSLVTMNLGDQTIVYRRRICLDEITVAKLLNAQMQSLPAAFSDVTIQDLRIPPSSPSPSADQLVAMQIIMSRNVSVLTGPPGSGKSLTIRWLTELATSSGKVVQLLAPTGRAAARLREVCGANCGGNATTIHMWMISKGPGPIDLIVVDETSMVDMNLLLLFLQACRQRSPTATIIFAGDVDQLPSIGAGNVLLDMISSGRIPVAQLTHIHRQGEGSGILRLAFAVRSGDVKAVRACANLAECSISLRSTEEELLAMIKTMCVLPQNIDMQVITPCKMGMLGTDAMNRSLQELLNPNVRSMTATRRMSDGSTFALNDKVIACKNDHRNGIYNGDIGRICGLAEGKLSVSFDSGKIHEYTDDEASETISLAYAITIHRTQGSEFPKTLILMPHSAWKMASQRLLYTAITRSKSSCVILGIKDILLRAIGNRGVPRNTRLASLCFSSFSNNV